MKFLKVLLLLVFVFTLSSCTDNPVVEENLLLKAKTELTIPTEVTEYELPTSLNGVEITWNSTASDTLTEDFKTIQSNDDQDVTLTAILTLDGKVLTKLFNVTITGTHIINYDLLAIQNAMTATSFESTEFSVDAVLPINKDGVTIIWSSNNSSFMANDGTITRPADGQEDCVVVMTASFVFNDEQVPKDYFFTVKAAVATVEYIGYYQGAEGLSGDTLKLFLNELIDEHTIFTYDQVKYLLAETDKDPNNPDNIILFYTGLSVSSTWDFGNTYNREHVWAKSHGSFGNDDGPGSDMHHLRPAMPIVNTYRSNLDFDEGGTLVPNTTDCYKDGDSFEPRDEVKGDVARIMFYMVVRYEGYDGFVDLELTENVDTSGPFFGKLSILLKWNLEDPVDEFEMNRNNVIYSYQHNRNPFIDHPEFAELIWG